VKVALADANDPHYEATIALARRLKQSMHKTMEHDMASAMERQAKYLIDYFKPPPRLTWRQVVAWRFRELRERVARWIAPWLGDRSDFD
jgi:hypothetical protein